jgi:hypothetical protein
LDAASDRAQCLQRATQLDVAVHRRPYRGESTQQLRACQRAQLAPQRLRGCDQQIAQLAHPSSARVHSTLPSSHKRPQRLTFTAGAWLCQLRLRQDTPRRPERIESVGLATASPFAPQPADLDDLLVLADEQAG